MRLWYIAWLRHLPSSVINYGNGTSFVLRRSTWSPMLSVSICYVNVKISENDRIKNNINCCWCNQQLFRTEPSTLFYMETASAQSILISYSKIWLLNCELATSRNLTEWIEHCHSDPPEVARYLHLGVLKPLLFLACNFCTLWDCNVAGLKPHVQLRLHQCCFRTGAWGPKNPFWASKSNTFCQESSSGPS